MNEELNEIEKAIIGGMVSSDQIYFKVIGALKAEDFMTKPHQILFNEICAFRQNNSTSNAQLFIEFLTSKKMLNQVGGSEYILQASVLTPLSDEINEYIHLVQDKSLVRHLFECFDQIKNDYETKSIEDIADFVGDAESKLIKVTEKRRVSDFRSTSEVIKSLGKEIEEVKNRRKELNLTAPYLTGFPTQYPALDKITGGLQPTDLIILGARPSVGKAAFALNIAQRVAKQGKTVGIFSLEMSAEQILLRILSNESQLTTNKIKAMNFASLQDGFFTKGSDEYNLNAAIEMVRKEKLMIDDTAALKLIDIQSKARKLKAKHPDLALIVIDYIGLITSPSKGNQGNRQQEVAEISRGLKFLAKDLQVPVLALSQVSREVDKHPEKGPGLSDIRDSGAIEQDADQVMFLYRKDYYQDKKDDEAPQDPPLEGETQSSVDSVSDVVLNISKNRNGRLGRVRFIFFKDTCRFEVAADEDEGEY